MKKDDRYDIARRNEVTRGTTNEVSGDNKYTEKIRRVLEKLGSLATAVADHFGWDPETVMKDFVKDLAIINNPSLLAELDTNNPIDKMTDQLMRMYLADDEAVNVLQNTALAQIMNMSEERAIQTLEAALGRGQLGTTRANQFLGNRNARRLGHNDSDFEETWNWEGWYISDIIDEIEPEFEMIENGEATRGKFKNVGDLKAWIKEQYPLNNVIKLKDFDTAVSFVVRHFNERVMNEFGGYTDYPIKDSVNRQFRIIVTNKESGSLSVFPWKDLSSLVSHNVVTIENEVKRLNIDPKTETYKVEYRTVTEENLNDSQSQEIAREYQRLSEKYDLDFDDLVYGENGFMNSCYPEGFPDFYGDVIFSEKYWNEFEKWLKDTKGIELKHEDNYDFLADSKEDEERFVQKFGEKELNRFKRLTQKLQGNYRDLTWVIANIDNKEDLNEILNNADYYGYEPIEENEDYVVFNIDNLQKCQKLASGTSWCITSPTAWNTNARFGARYHFYINKYTGDKYCVAMLGGLKEIVDKNDNELAKLPSGVPSVGGIEITSSVVREDTTNQQALLETALANIQILPVETLRIAYDDMFGEELDILDDEEVKAWLTNKLPQIDTNELKRYIENHINDFVVVEEASEDEEDEDFDEEDFDEEDEDYEMADSLDNEEVKKFEEEIKAYCGKFKNLKFEQIEEADEDRIVVNLSLTLHAKDSDLDMDEIVSDFDLEEAYDDEGHREEDAIRNLSLSQDAIFNFINKKYNLDKQNFNSYVWDEYLSDVVDYEYSDFEISVYEEKPSWGENGGDPGYKETTYSGKVTVTILATFAKD